MHFAFSFSISQSLLPETCKPALHLHAWLMLQPATAAPLLAVLESHIEDTDSNILTVSDGSKADVEAVVFLLSTLQSFVQER